MKINILQIFTVLALNFLVACTTVENNSDIDDSVPEKDLLENADWLTGSWQHATNEARMNEIWSRLNDTTMEAVTFGTEGKDTIAKETIQLIQRKNEVFYVVTFGNQNESKSISFKLKSSSKDSLVFKNLKHDFPEKISYYKISNDSLLVEISGVFDGKYSKEKFPMGRLK